MGRARTLPQLDLIVRAILARLDRLEARRRDQFVPVALSTALLVNATAPTATHAVLITRVGSSMTMWVRVTVGTGSLLLSLADDTGVIGATTTAAKSGIYAVKFAIPDGWEQGDQHQVSLRAWVSSGSGTILPMSVITS